MFYNVIKGILGVILRLIYRIKVQGVENIPNSGRLILGANHWNLLDPILISIVFPRQVFWMAKKELFENKLLEVLIRKLGAFPVDREESDITAIKNALKVLKNENVLGIFPEGTRVSEIDLDKAKAGVALLSIRSQAPLIPVLIKSNYKIFSKVNITIGNPIDNSEYYGKKLSTEEYQNISKSILSKIYELNS